MQLFHQNLRQFNGGTPAKNAAYTAQFAAIAAGAAANPIGVAGFTEVTNSVAAPAALGAMAATLFGGAITLTTICCGKTGAGVREYVCIATPGAPVGVGRVMIFQAAAGAIHLRTEYDAVADGWGADIPEGASADYRGPVFVTIAAPGGGNIVIGFMHNRYGDGAGAREGPGVLRAISRGQVPRMLEAMSNCGGAPAGPAAPAAAVYLGGDFNLPPKALGHAGGRRYAQDYSVGLAAAPVLPPLPVGVAPVVFTPGGTLWSGNLYDYWYSDQAPGALPVASVDGRTLDSRGAFANLMSDHCASLLAI